MLTQKLQHRTAPSKRDKGFIFSKVTARTGHSRKLHPSAVKFRKFHQIKRLRWWRSGSIRSRQDVYLPGPLATDVDEQDEVRVQQIRGEGCTVGVNKRGDPCSAGKVAIEIKNKLRFLGPTYFVPLPARHDDAEKHPSKKTSLPSVTP